MSNNQFKDYFYSLKTKGTSSKDVCVFVNKLSSNQFKVDCYDYEGGGIYLSTFSDPTGVKHKIERGMNIKLGEPQEVNDRN